MILTIHEKIKVLEKEALASIISSMRQAHEIKRQYTCLIKNLKAISFRDTIYKVSRSKDVWYLVVFWGIQGDQLHNSELSFKPLAASYITTDLYTDNLRTIGLHWLDAPALKEVPISDLPLYMGAPYRTDLFSKILKDGKLPDWRLT